MRVLEFTPDIPLEYGGGGMMRHIIGLSRYLRDAGHEVTIASARVPAGALLAPGFVRARGLGVVPYIRQVDVIHVHGGRMPEVALTALLARAFRKPFLYTPHAYYDTPPTLQGSLQQRVRQWLRVTRKTVWDQVVERALLRWARAVVLLSEPWVTYLRDRHLPTGRVVIIPSATEPVLIEPISERLIGSPAILSVGRLDPVKCIDDVIAALREPGLGAAHLHVVGRGLERERLEAEAHSYGVSDRVHFYGFVPDEEVAGLAAGADVYVIASREEGMPLTLIEMILRGLPVAASDIPGHRPLLESLGLEDRMFPLHARRALAETVTRSVAEGVPAGMPEQLASRYSWGVVGQRILDLYRTALT
ncbi:MAG: glycosyltransferase [Dehalococcoidia bacterium]|nr:MAG: glycosyltransferase [Dehalococcoidia bacterium]